MAIDTYGKLQSEISDTLDRADLIADVTAYSGGNIDGAIKRAIAKTEFRVQRRLRVRQMESSTAVTLTAGTSAYALPSDYLSSKLVYIDGDPLVTCTQTSLENLIATYPEATRDKPDKVAIYGTNLYFRRLPDQAYTAQHFYYQKIPALSAPNASNWMLTDAPDLYLYGACLELTAHLSEDEHIQLWKGALDEAIRDITGDDMTAKWSGVLTQSVLPVQVVV